MSASAPGGTLAGSGWTLGAAENARPSGSSTSLETVSPGLWSIVIGRYASLDIDGDGEAFFLDLDDDGDGLLDVAETATGIFLSIASTGTSPFLADTDGDGFGDWLESVAGTNPNDPSSFPNAPQVPALGMVGQGALVLSLILLALIGLRSWPSRNR